MPTECQILYMSEHLSERMPEKTPQCQAERTLDEISDRMPDGNGMSWVMSARMSVQVPERMSDKT